MQRRPRFEVFAVLVGLMAGLALAAVAVLSYEWNVPSGVGATVLRALLVYGLAGGLTGWLVRRAHDRQQQPVSCLPPALHAMAAGVLIVAGHFLLLEWANAGPTPGAARFLTEAVLAALLAAAAGMIGGRRLQR